MPSTRLRMRLRKVPRVLLAIIGVIPAAFGQTPYGLDTRAAIGPYLNNIMPSTTGAFPFPLLLSATGAFSDLRALTPAPGLIPFTVNSALWSDGAVKTRWIALPNDGPPYGAAEQIGFAATGEWSFPNGTVFVKNFELIVNEITGARKRLETRFLVRDANGEVYGVTYRWRPDDSEADLLSAAGLDENFSVATISGAVRVQKWSYPSRQQCLFCHNTPASYVLGLKTHQQNGVFTYPATGRTDNQLRTLAHLGMLNPSPKESEIPTFLHATSINDQTASVQHRMRSWIDSNCSQCHRPTGFCPQFDARFATPLSQQNLINTYLLFRDPAGSEFYQRDDSLGTNKMPPLAKNVIHEAAMANLRQWIASPLEVLSVHLDQDNSHLLVRFNSILDAETASTAANYTLDQGASVSNATAGSEPDTVLLSVSALNSGQSYLLTISDIRDTAPSANTIWPQSRVPFVAQVAPEPAAHRLANMSTRQFAGAGDNIPVAGFVVRGTTAKRVLVRALGPSLGSAGVADALSNPTLELHDATGALIASNDDWGLNYNQQEITDSSLAPVAAAESAILMRLPATENGSAYTAVLRGAQGTTGTCLMEIYDLDRGVGSVIVNYAGRGFVQTEDNVLIAGMIIVGPAAQKVILRAIGPSLPIPGKLNNPTLELHDANGAVLEANDDWVLSNNKQAMIDSGLAPTNDSESAIIRTLPPANYTAIVRGVNHTTGIAVVEAYGLD